MSARDDGNDLARAGGPDWRGAERCPFPGCNFIGAWAAMLEHAAAHDIPHQDEGRGAWLATRRTFIGASEAPTVCGLNPWRGALSVYASKVAAPAPEIDDEHETDQQRLGSIFEVPLLRDYAERHHVTLNRPTTRRHPTMPYLAATPDAEHVDDTGTLVQVKLVGARVAHHWSSGPPAYVIGQVQAELDVFQRRRAVILVVVGGTELQEHPIEADPEIAAFTREIVRGFWFDNIVPRVLPVELDTSGDDTDELRRLWPRALAPLATATVEERDLALRYAAVSEQISALKATKNSLKSAICARIGQREGFAWAGDVVGRTLAQGYATWKAPRGSPRWKAVAEALIERFLTPAEAEEVIADHTPPTGERKLFVHVKDTK